MCQISKSNKNNDLGRQTWTDPGDGNCHFAAQGSTVRPRAATAGRCALCLAGNYGHAGLGLLPERVANGACLSLAGGRCLQSIELPGVALGDDDPG